MVRSLYLFGGLRDGTTFVFRQCAFCGTLRMADYNIHRGVDKPVEFKGLFGQYLFIFVCGVLLTFVVFVVLYLSGVDQTVCFGFAVCASLLLGAGTFRLQAKYGRFGLLKRFASMRHPRRIVHRRSIYRLIKIR